MPPVALCSPCWLPPPLFVPVSLRAVSARCVGDAAGISQPWGCLQQEVLLWPFEQLGVWTEFGLLV